MRLCRGAVCVEQKERTRRGLFGDHVRVSFACAEGYAVQTAQIEQQRETFFGGRWWECGDVGLQELDTAASARDHLCYALCLLPCLLNSQVHEIDSDCLPSQSGQGQTIGSRPAAQIEHAAGRQRCWSRHRCY